MWVRMAPVWSRPPWVIVVNPGIPIATCFPPATRNFVGLSNLDTDEYIYVRSAPRSPAWLRMLRDHIDVAVDRARTLTAGHLVAFADQSALWEEWADRPLDDATYAAMETATA
jgi:hypothetical protein